MKNSKEDVNFEEIEQKYDPQLSFRKLGSNIAIVISILLVLMSVYHLGIRFWFGS